MAASPGRGTRRIFLAVPVAPALRDTMLSVLGSRLGDHGALRWVRGDGLHVTLRFLGEITPFEVDRAVKAARAAAGSLEVFSITFAGGGAFPSLRAPRVVWAGVTGGADRLVSLAKTLDAALAKQRFPGTPQRFHPHVTVARVRAGAPPPDLRFLAEQLSGPDAPVIGTQLVDAIVVMESTLAPSGARYQEVYRAAFGEGSPPGA